MINFKEKTTSFLFPNLNKVERFTLLIILLLATVLRLWNPLHIPFMYDESAVMRPQFDTLKGLFDSCIKPDNHPPLILLFLFFWVKIFGIHELAIKLPFILMGITSTWMIFRLGQQWFSKQTGLMAAAYFATLEYSILFSQLSRPYISGVFFCLLLVWYWDKIIFHSEKNFTKNLIWFIVFSTLCAYNHYFSLLFAILLSLIGLLFIKKTKLVPYIISGGVILLFFLPFFPIFQEQFQRRGIGSWLRQPHPDFILDFFKYLFHFSNISLGLIGMLILIGILTFKKASFSWKYFIISISLFYLPFVIAYVYSIKVSSLLQYSVLIFGFPFLLLALLGPVRFKKQWMVLSAVLLILSVNTYSLCVNRQYYRYFYQEPYEQILIETETDAKLYHGNMLQIIDSDHLVSGFYEKKNQITAHFLWLDAFQNLADFRKMLSNDKYDYVSLGSLSSVDPVVFPLILNEYPYVVREVNVFSASYYVFSRKPQSNEFQPYIKTKTLDYGLIPAKKGLISDTLPPFLTNTFFVDSNMEYNPGFVIPINQLIENNTNFIDITLDYYSIDSLKKLSIVSEVSAQDSILDWRCSELSKYEFNHNPQQLKKAFLSIKLSDIYMHYQDIQLKVFIWNPGKEKAFLKTLRLNTRKGNPIVYGLYDKIQP